MADEFQAPGPRPAGWKASRPVQRAAFAAALVAFAASIATGFLHTLVSSGTLPGIILSPHLQGEASLGRRDYARAQAEFEAAVAVDPADVHSLRRLAATLDLLGDGAAAFAAHERWLEA